MRPYNHIEAELKDLDSGLPYVPGMPYDVPAGYFDRLPALMLLRVKQLDSTMGGELGHLSALLASLPKKVPFTAPSNYFADLIPVALSVVHSADQSAADELAAISPLLGSLNKQVPYAVPAGYFEKQITTVDAPVVSIQRRSRRWTRYAVAASVIAMICFAGLQLVKKATDVEGLSLVKYEKKLNREIRKTSDKDLNEFLQNTGVSVEATETAKVNPAEVKELLKDVPDQELNDFLEQTAVNVSDAEPSLMN